MVGGFFGSRGVTLFIKKADEFILLQIMGVKK